MGQAAPAIASSGNNKPNASPLEPSASESESTGGGGGGNVFSMVAHFMFKDVTVSFFDQPHLAALTQAVATTLAVPLDSVMVTNIRNKTSMILADVHSIPVAIRVTLTAEQVPTAYQGDDAGLEAHYEDMLLSSDLLKAFKNQLLLAGLDGENDMEVMFAVADGKQPTIAPSENEVGVLTADASSSSSSLSKGGVIGLSVAAGCVVLAIVFSGSYYHYRIGKAQPRTSVEGEQ